MDLYNPLMSSNYIIYGGLEKIKSLFKKELFLELDNFAKCVYDNVVGLCRKTVCVCSFYGEELPLSRSEAFLLADNGTDSPR